MTYKAILVPKAPRKTRHAVFNLDTAQILVTSNLDTEALH